MPTLGRLRRRPRTTSILNHLAVTVLRGDSIFMIERLREKIATRQGGTLLLALTYLGLCTLLRVGLLIASAGSVSWHLATFGAFFTGFLFDLLMAWWLAIPYAFLTAFFAKVPSTGWRRMILATAWFFGVWLFVFWKMSEILFWHEFNVRFNFIAVDYLVYTVEVVKNIIESYSMPLILAGITAVVVGIVFALNRLRLWQAWARADDEQSSPWVTPVLLTLPFFGLLVVAYGIGRSEQKAMMGRHTSIGERLTAGLRHMGDIQPGWENSYDTELGKNGEYAFLAAFWANELEWTRFYPSLENPVQSVRQQLVAQGEVALSGPGTDITRKVTAKGVPRKLNVIQITVESLSAEYLGCYDHKRYKSAGLTPNLDRIARESLWFSNCYASGTRTVRGMEALTLSIPPIPGQSVLRRKGCENLCTLGSVLAAHGYDTSFIYGGDGFFDNMNYFFGTNGYRVVDQPVKAQQGVKPVFANAWGASDEDAYAWSMAEADRAFAEGKPFHQFIMTTSNHRPFTWPAGKIDEKLNGTAEGGVAYSDYAIGAFLEAARSKPWFKDTIFVIVADHCAKVAGKQELEVKKYEIPLFIWSPGNIAPKQVDTLVAQLDFAPTLLGLLNLSYESRFFGSDALSPSYQPRIFISNYQKLGMIRDGQLTVVKPVRDTARFNVNLATGKLAPSTASAADAEKNDEATKAYYQGADLLFNNGGLKSPTTR